MGSPGSGCDSGGRDCSESNMEGQRAKVRGEGSIGKQDLHPVPCNKMAKPEPVHTSRRQRAQCSGSRVPTVGHQRLTCN